MSAIIEQIRIDGRVYGSLRYRIQRLRAQGYDKAFTLLPDRRQPELVVMLGRLKERFYSRAAANNTRFCWA